MRDETITVVHGDLEKESPVYDNGSIQCPMDGCTRRYETVSGVKMHITNYHGIRASETCTCVICDEVFTNSKASRDRKCCSRACGVTLGNQHRTNNQ